MRNKMWWMLALLITGATMLVSCKDDDEKAVSEDEIAEDRYVEAAKAPTEDQLGVMVEGRTVVVEHDYEGVGAALVKRIKNRSYDMLDPELQNVIIPAETIDDFDDEDLSVMLPVLASGGSIIVVNPTMGDLTMLASKMEDVLIKYLMDEMPDNDLTDIIYDYLDDDVIERILSWSDEAAELGYDEDDRLALVGLSGDNTYVIEEIDDGEEKTYTFPVVAYDQEGNDSITNTITYTGKTELNNYAYGVYADNVADWLNEVGSKKKATAEAALRREVANLMARRAGGSAENYLQQITNSVDRVYDVSINVPTPNGPDIHHNATLKYRIWSAYCGDPGREYDVYCVTQEVTAYNQQLGCGPSDEFEWYSAKGWAPWLALSDIVSILRPSLYGPYMKRIHMRCQLKDGDNVVTLEDYLPKNSTTGGNTVTDVLTYNVGANVSYSEKSHGSVGLSGGVTWGTNVSHFDADLSMKANPSADGTVEWLYDGYSVDSHFTMKFWKDIPTRHEFARAIQTNTCTVQQAWVWTVKSKSSTVTIHPIFQLLDDWMTYDRAFSHPGQAVPHYIQIGDFQILAPIVVNCPPRFTQTWSMSVESDDVSADKLEVIEKYLQSQLKAYFVASYVFHTKKADHKKSYNEGKNPAEYDEIGQFIHKAKRAFATDNVKEILRSAGKRAGVPDNGSYTIVWRQTDPDIYSDREEYTFDMKVPK